MIIYKNKHLCKVRTITTFISLKKSRRHWEREILKATKLCSRLSTTLSVNGYTVQSLRIVTNPFGEYLNTRDIKTAKNDLAFISNILNSKEMPSIRIRFAIGEAKTNAEINLLPELIKEFGDLCNVCVNVASNKFGFLDNQLIEKSAETIQKISQITPNGEGNFNFTVNFNCPPHIPYFPASYHQSHLDNCFVIGLETPDLLLAALKHQNEITHASTHQERHHDYFKVMHVAIQHHVNQITDIIQHEELGNEFTFAGFDSSAAPSKDCIR